jgi:phosphotransferase system enzyme I (PtsP)
LLRRLREVMAQRESAQARLDKVVVLIASNMVAEVCSLYLRRRDGSLELFATEGLNPLAVHNTHLKPGEGLVGLIAEQAEPMQFPDAQHHPAFSYRPETGEEVYQSFCGVPILRGGHTIGVLTVQNRTKRQYSDEEIEALQTTAMVLAEMIASGGFGVTEEVSAETRRELSVRFTGLPISEGVALGHVVLHEPRIVVTRLIAEDVEVERRRLSQAIEELTGMIDNMLERGDLARAGEHREVLEAFRMFAHDHGWRRRLDEAMLTGLTAEAAVQRVRNDTRARMLRQIDPHARERLHDIDDLSNRLLRLLSGGAVTAAAGNLPQDTILIARTMGPAELLDYDRQRLRGLVLEEGGSASHVAIVARALGIAAISQVKGVLDGVEAGDAAIVDAPYQANAGGGVGLCRQGALQGAAPGAIRRAQDRPLGHARRRACRDSHQCRAPVRSAASRSVGRRRHRALPHRAAIHDLGDLPEARAADTALQGDPRRLGRQAGGVPLARCRRRQGASLLPRERGGEPGHRLARDPHGAR